jgi:hypothetical protein
LHSPFHGGCAKISEVRGLGEENLAERVSITVESSLEHGGDLTVQDAMRQVLDFFDVVASAANDDARSGISWRLVSATTNSPYTAIAEAVSIA